MQYNFSVLQKRVTEIQNWLVDEHKSIRTGRATPTLLDGVKVDAYGSRMPLNQTATVMTEGPTTLRVTPFDRSLMKDVEKAITAADLGVSIGADSNGIRVTFPSLTSERRTQLIKLAKQKMEEARITLRGERDHVWTEIQKQEKEGIMSEDDKFRSKEAMEKIITGANEKFEEQLEKKEKEINE
ncbi:MAG: ribosome recycling factor [Minisyncoccia bacterium]